MQNLQTDQKMKKNLSLTVISLALLLTNGCSKSGSNSTPSPADTKLKLTITDLSTNTKAAGSTVALYASLADWQNKTNAVATDLADANGTVTFGNLQSKQYYWYIKLGCRDNTFETNTTSSAIPLSTTTSLNVSISGVGALGFVNTSNNPYRVYVNGVIVINSMPGNSTDMIKMGPGLCNIRVLQLSGYVLTPTDKTYSGTLVCGSTLTTTFP